MNNLTNISHKYTIDSIKDELRSKNSLQRVQMFAANYERLTQKLTKLIQNYDHHHSSHSGYFQTSAVINELEIEINKGKAIAEAMQEFIIELAKQKNDKNT